MTVAEARAAMSEQTPCEVYVRGGWLPRGWHEGRVISLNDTFVVVTCGTATVDVRRANGMRFLRRKGTLEEQFTL